MAKDVTCFYTVLRNNSGVLKHFSFIPPFGRYLDHGEEVAVLGDIFGQFPSYPYGRKKLEALLAALESGDLDIVSTPAPIYEDVVTGESRMIQIEDDVINTVAPCYESLSTDS